MYDFDKNQTKYLYYMNVNVALNGTNQEVQVWYVVSGSDGNWE